MTRHGRSRVLFLACLIATPTANCSYLLVSGPSAGNPAGCTEEMLWPVADSVYAGLSAGTLLYAAVSSDSARQGQGITRNDQIFLSSSSLLVFASSAIFGMLDVNSCRAAIARHADADADRDLRQAVRWRQRQRQQQEFGPADEPAVRPVSATPAVGSPATSAAPPP